MLSCGSPDRLRAAVHPVQSACHCVHLPLTSPAGSLAVVLAWQVVPASGSMLPVWAWSLAPTRIYIAPGLQACMLSPNPHVLLQET